MIPKYNLEKIKLGVDEKMWARAVELYEAGKVSDFEESYLGYTAAVFGVKPYDVAISENDYSQGDCSCFMGRSGTICKHMAALAIYAVLRGTPIK